MSASLDSRSTAAIDAVTTESWSGRSSRIRPSRSDSPESSTLARAYRWRRCTPSQSSSGAAPCMPHTHACTCLVVGPGHPGRREGRPRQGVEQRRLPAAGAARQRDDRVVAGQAQPLARPLEHRVRVVEQRLAEAGCPRRAARRARLRLPRLAWPGPADRDQLGERVEAPGQVLLAHPLRADRGEHAHRAASSEYSAW